MRKSTRLAAILILALAGLLLLAACGEPAKLDRLEGIPEPPEGIAPIPTEQLPIDPETVAESYRLAMAAQSLELGVYAAGSDVPFADLAAYYRGLLSDAWEVYQSEQIQAARADGIEATMWLNEAEGQMLSIQYLPAPEYGGNLLVVLFAEQ
jgi:hypothetical protein